jgi:integrase
MRGQLNYLCDTQCKAAKPAKKDHRLNDGGGLFMLVKPSGSKLWRMKYIFKGTTKLASFGKFPAVTLKLAREKRDTLAKLVERNIDPVEKKKAAKKAENETFKVVAKAWHTRMNSKWTERHADTVWRSLQDDVFPKLGSKPVSTITSSMVLNTASAIAENRNAQDVARRVLRRISNVLEYAAVTDLIPVNPAIGLMKYMPENKKNRKPMAAIKWKELPEFLQAVDGSDMFIQTELALRLLMFVFVRPGELRYSKWSEFDLGNKLWTIPAERMKMKVEHQVPLSTQAVSLLKQLKPFAGDSDFVLPGRSNIIKPISENTVLFAIYKLKRADGTNYRGDMTAHGCRALASSWLNEEGRYQDNGQLRAFNPDSIERQLAHGEPNKVRDAYNRADYMGEREIMMQVWADFIDRCADQSGKVVPIRKGKMS